ncbi:glycosyltransferase family 2 protein [Aliterella atlantica]|uniref:Glycosyl transferase family A n=1 Tax=Aliterella atlantica CENA595 TaxID=1618023 RepID=A0A0D8ZV54_9CYAN|nr:glycosyltransferase [Aliterella atlantica]KJH71121.1 glycosyl transferase family A [Aliterella atlantica CENA595]
MPTISVVIPAYNAERTILKTIESVQKQTFLDLEIIVINNGSTDRTLKLLQSIKDERMKVFSYRHDEASVARNRGISHTVGEFIAFLDADDLWISDKLEMQLGVLQQHSEAGVAYSWNYYFIDGREDTLIPYKPVFFTGNVYTQLLVSNFVANGSNILVRRKAIESVGGFDPTMQACEDWEFYIRLAACWQFVVVPKHQILYRQSANTMTSKVELVEREALKLIEKAYQAAPPEYQYLKKQSLAWIYEYCTQQYLKHSNDLIGINRARQKLWQAICLHPQILLEDYAQILIRWLIKKWLKIQLRIL